LNSSEAQKLLDESLKYPQLKIMEAFMYRFHPQWIKVKEMINSGKIGKLKAIQSSFSFFEDDPNSIVNSKEYGGGSLMDIGCYPISLSRFLFDSEPKSVSAEIEYHPEFKTDTLANGILNFDKGSSIFFSSTLVTDNQQVEIFGTKGSIEFEIPFNPPADKPVKIWLNKEGIKEQIEFDICDQYTIQADLFSMAIIQNTEVPTPLHDAVNNMIVIEKLKESNKTGKRINL
ncbi:MAG: gfo/Idh/MocA family oxidoreductase, partial [Bacteroidetes bacterium]